MIQKTNAWTCRWLAFLALIRDFSCSEIPFKVEETHLTAREGSCIEIKCTATQNRDVTNAEWFWIKDAEWIDTTRDFNGTIIYSSTSRRPASQDLAGRVEYTGSSSFKSYDAQCGILISNLKKTDSGNYAFRYDGTTRGQKWKTNPEVNLIVEENPCPIIFEAVMNGFHTVTLQCSTSSSCASYPEITGVNQIVRDQQKHVIENYKKTTVSFKIDWQDDGKVMSCQIMGNMEKCLARTITLTVEYAPRNTRASVSPQYVKEGDDVILTCSTRGRPHSTFSWFKDRQKKVDGAEWKINSIEASDSGEYYCEAQNKMGTNKSNTLHIDVKYAPSLNATQMKPSDVQEGVHVTLNCIVARSNPQPHSYTWYKNSEIIWHQSDTFDIPNIKQEDSGSYKCKATNSVGSGSSPLRHIKVQYSPRNTVISRDGSLSTTVKVNDPLTLSCKTDAHPVPWSYSWYHRREHEQMNSSPWTTNMTSGNTLHFKRVGRTDDGCYMCSATNSIQKGGNSSSLCLQVLYPPTKLVLSLVPEAREGDLITINCTVQSFPLSVLTLTWTKANSHTSTQLHPRAGSRFPNILQVSFNVTLTHAGLHTCSAVNSEGSSRTYKELMVTYSPKNVTILAQPSTVELNENEQLILHCMAQSNPPVTSYTWTKTTAGKDEIVWRAHTFTVKSLTPSHSGLYSCTVSNALGTGKSQQATVKVKYAPKNTKIMSSWHDGKSPVMLSCISHSFPPVKKYKWFMVKDSEDIFVSGEQNLTVQPDKPGIYYCDASNEIDGKKSNTIRLFLDRDFMQVVQFILLCLVVLLALLIVFLVCRHKRNKSTHQGTSNTLPCWGRFGFLVGRWNGTRENLVDESGLTEPRRSRDDLMPGVPYRPNPQPCRPPPDSTSSSNINTVYSTVNLPLGTQGHSPQEPIRNRAAHTEDDAVNYVSLHSGNQEKNRRRPKAKAGVDDVYAKVAKPKPPYKDEHGRLEDYENVNGAHAPKCPIPVHSDTETSEEDVEINYTRVHFKAKPGHQAAKHCCNRGYSDSDETKTQYSRVNIS